MFFCRQPNGMSKFGRLPKFFGWVLRLVLSGIILFFIFNWVGADGVFQALIGLDVGSLGMIFILIGVSLIIRGWRVRIVQESTVCIPNTDYILIAIFHNAANQVMPFRSGELAFPLLLKRYLGHQMSQSTASLLLIRFIEAMVLGGLVIIGLFFVLSDSTDNFGRIIFLLLFLLFMLVFWGWMPRLLLIGYRVTRSVSGSGEEAWRKLVLRLGQALHAVSGELNKSKGFSVYLLILVLTVANWLVLIAVCWVVLLSVGVQVNYAEAMVGASVASVAQFIPLGSFGNIGPLEAGWTLGFVFVGVDAKQALSSGVVLHLVMIGYALLLAAIAMVSKIYMARNRQQ